MTNACFISRFWTAKFRGGENGVLNSQMWRSLGSGAQAQQDDGFTLLEVLVALAILAMSLSVLLGVFSIALDRARETQRRDAALNYSEALILRAETVSPSDLKDAEGTTDQSFHWRVRLQSFGSEQDRANWPGRPVQVWATVGWEDHGRERSVALTTLRLLPSAKND
jgi:general secretion pathway protein I